MNDILPLVSALLSGRTPDAAPIFSALGLDPDAAAALASMRGGASPEKLLPVIIKLMGRKAPPAGSHAGCLVGNAGQAGPQGQDVPQPQFLEPIAGFAGEEVKGALGAYFGECPKR